MTLTDLWFIAVAVLLTGYFVLEGFDFGVGMLMPILGRGKSVEADTKRRVLLNTIGPVWDGNEVWLITGGGAMFAAFPGWYATAFSALYAPLLVILVGLITRVVSIEWRGKIDDPRWRRLCDLGIGLGSWLPAILWGAALANLLRGLPIDADHQFTGSLADILSPYALLGGAATCLLFLFHGALFLGLKTEGEIQPITMKLAARLSIPFLVVGAAFLLWTQLSYGNGWTWIAVGIALASAVAASLAAFVGRDGWGFAASCVTVGALGATVFGSMYPVLLPSTTDHAYDITTASASSTHYTLTVMTWATVVVLPVVLGYQAWTYWVFRKRISMSHIPPSIGLPAREQA
jgi:cytochrome d ubiquinol oxidase subunit II